MAIDRPDLIAYLQEEVAVLEQKLKVARASLRAAQNALEERQPISILASASAVISTQPRGSGGSGNVKIKWTKEVIKVFREANFEERLHINDVCDRLDAKGIPAKTNQGRNNVNTALSRQVGKFLERIGDGYYRLLIPGDDIMNKQEGAQPDQG